MSNRCYHNDLYETIVPSGTPSYNILKSSKYYNEDTHIKNTYNKLHQHSKNIYCQLNINNKLPEGWIELFDEVSGKNYYACMYTKHTQWLNPTIPIGTIMPNGLPYGWDKEWNEESNSYYYVNHVGRFNTWNPPIKQRSYKGDNYKW